MNRYFCFLRAISLVKNTNDGKVENAVVTTTKATVEGVSGVASYAAGSFASKVWPTLNTTTTSVPPPPLIKPAGN